MINSPFGPLMPWRKVSDWSCSACGECCRHFEVQLSPYDFARIIALGGAPKVRFEQGKIYLSKRWDGRCAFQWRFGDSWICSLADGKPRICKLWPFHVFNRPIYGKGRLAEFEYEGKRLYVYVNSYCPNLILGHPTERLATKVIPEVLGIALGALNSQKYSTSQRVGNYGFGGESRGWPSGERTGSMALDEIHGSGSPRASPKAPLQGLPLGLHYQLEEPIRSPRLLLQYPFRILKAQFPSGER